MQSSLFLYVQAERHPQTRLFLRRKGCQVEISCLKVGRKKTSPNFQANPLWVQSRRHHFLEFSCHLAAAQGCYKATLKLAWRRNNLAKKEQPDKARGKARAGGSRWGSSDRSWLNKKSFGENACLKFRNSEVFKQINARWVLQKGLSWERFFRGQFPLPTARCVHGLRWE